MKNLEADARIIKFLGPRFAEFQKLALMVKEQPATRAYAESQMKRMLEEMLEAERDGLRQALKDAGAYGRRMK